MKFKKIATLFLTVCILATMSFGLTAEAAVNIAPNPDFSQWENGVPVGWNVTAPATSTAKGVISKVDVSADDAVESDSALFIKTVKADDETAGAAGVDYSVSLAAEYRDHMIPGESYVISFMYKVAGGWHNVMGSSSNSKQYRDYSTDADGKVCDESLGAFGNAAAWTKFEATFTASKHRTYHTFIFDSNGNQTSFYMTDVKIMGVRSPRHAQNVELGENIIKNGDFTSGNEGWSFSGGAAVEGESIALTGEKTASYDLTFTAQPEKIYAFEIDVKTTGAADVAAASGAPKVSVDTYLGDTLLTNGKNGSGFFYNRLIDFDYTFAPRALDTWEKIKFNYCPPDAYGWQNLKIRFTFSSAVEGATVAFDNFKLCSTTNLLGNADFEGLLVASKVTEGIESPSGMHGPWSVPANQNIAYLLGEDTNTEDAIPGAYQNGVSVKLQNVTAEPFLGQQVRVESGKTYRMALMTYTNLRDKIPHFYWQAMQGETGLPYAAGSHITALPKLANYWDNGEAYFTMPTQTTVNEEVVDWNTMHAQVMFRMANVSSSYFACIDNIQLTEVNTGVNFYTENADKVSKLEEVAGENVVAYYASAELPTDTEVTFILALYDVSGSAPMLVNYTASTDITSVEKPIHNSIFIPDDGKEYKLSAFCLDAIAGLEALEDKVDLT